jgi:hypothetical protein
MKRLLVGLAFAALALPASALAGGWATAGVGPPPDDMGPGQTWDAKVTILQHGNHDTPLMGVVPTLTIRKGSISKTFKGTTTDAAGVSTIKVVFPSAGTWSYAVYDGFSEYGGATTHKFPPVMIGAAGDSGGGFPTMTVTSVLLALMGMALVLYLLARRVRVRAPAPTH